MEKQCLGYQNPKNIGKNKAIFGDSWLDPPIPQNLWNIVFFWFSRRKTRKNNIWRLLAGPSHKNLWKNVVFFVFSSFFCFPNVWSSKPARCLARFGWWPPLSAARGFRRYALYILCIYRPSGFLT